MTIATPERYAEMLDAARRGGYAYPAINVTSSQTLNAALKGFADAESDGIIQISVGGAAYVSGIGVNDRVTGSLALAAFAHEVAAKYPNITIALHTDHCAKQYLDEWARPLLAHEADQVARGQEPTFQSHMWDGSTVPLKENLDIAEELLDGVDVYRTVNGIARAFLFAGMEADVARDAGEWVCLTEFLGGFFKLALLYEGIVAANVGPRRARRHAGRNLALVGVEAEHVEAARLEAGPASDAFVLIDNVDHVLSPWRSPRRGGRLCEG